MLPQQNKKKLSLFRFNKYSHIVYVSSNYIYYIVLGIATMIRPCMMRLGTYELIHSESISQMTVFLAGLTYKYSLYPS